jgi:protein-S-isoprenylcysteine O-methyltransferase Ste14
MTAGRIWWVLYGLWVCGEVSILLFTRIKSTSGENRDRGSLRMLWAVIMTSSFVGMGYGATHGPNLPDAARWAGWASLALIVVGLAIRGTAIWRLGRSFSANVAITETQKLETGGMFRLVRHPSYTGMLLIFLSMGLKTGNWVSVLILTVPPVLALLYRIKVEEDALHGAFGVEYEEYCRRSKRLVPGIY